MLLRRIPKPSARTRTGVSKRVIVLVRRKLVDGKKIR